VRTFHHKHVALVFALLAVTPLLGCGGDGSGPGGQRNAPSSITVLADSSLKDAFTQIGKRFEADTPGKSVEFSFGQSATLAQQAAAGDPGDVLTTADRSDMNSAEKVQLSTPIIFATKGSATYSIASLTQSRNTSLSQTFITYVSGPTGQQILRRSGFKVP
jgi:ABC-type molybdate transport system substrate-binding protein